MWRSAVDIRLGTWRTNNERAANGWQTQEAAAKKSGEATARRQNSRVRNQESVFVIGTRGETRRLRRLDQEERERERFEGTEGWK